MKSTDSTGESDPAVAAAVRLLHRRRGWIWATAISVVAFLVACGLLGARAPDASGAGVAVASVFILLLAATAVVGLVAAIVDTVRVHRLDPGVRAQAAPRTAHYPVRAHAYRYPPRHRWTWVFSWLVMAILLGLGVVALPALVDGVAYLAGAERFAVLILFAIYKTVRQCDGIDSTQARAWRSASCRRAGQPERLACRRSPRRRRCSRGRWATGRGSQPGRRTPRRA